MSVSKIIKYIVIAFLMKTSIGLYMSFENYENIRQHLASNARYTDLKDLQEEITADIFIAETERVWAEEMAKFKAMMKKNGWEGRTQMLKSKEQVGEAWKRASSVFLDQLKVPGAKLYKYRSGSGSGRVYGYIIIQKDATRYWLSL